MTGGAEAAEDVVQEAFVKAFQSIDRFDARRPFRPWLLAIVANEARSQARSRGRSQRRDDLAFAGSPGATAPSAEEVALARIGSGELTGALTELAIEDREVLMLRFVLDLGEAEAAAVLGCRPGTVKSRTSRALTRLRVRLEGAR